MEAARTLATTRRYRDLPAKDVPALVELVVSAGVNLPPFVQAKLAVWRSAIILDALEQCKDKKEAKDSAREFVTLHLLSAKRFDNPTPEIDLRLPNWSDVIQAAMKHDEELKASASDAKAKAQDDPTDWEVRSANIWVNRVSN